LLTALFLISLTINCSKVKFASDQIASITIDDVVEGISVNGKLQTIKPTQGDVNKWDQLKKYKLNFNEGDTIEIFGKNLGGPAGIIASFTWTNQYGIAQTWWTDNTWTCGGVKPTNFGANGVKPWNKINGIDDRAQCIWNSNKQVAGDRTSCKGKVPKTKSGVISLTVDNYLENITVNGKALRVEYVANILDWTKTKVIHANIKKGDKIKIYGSNISGPAGILATIQYSHKGDLKSWHTGRAWKCKKVPAVLQATNNGKSNVWGTLQGINAKAWWIWNSHQQINNSIVACSSRVGIYKKSKKHQKKTLTGHTTKL